MGERGTNLRRPHQDSVTPQSLGWCLHSNGRWQSLVIESCLYRDPPIGCPPLRMASLSPSDLPEFTLLFKAHTPLGSDFPSRVSVHTLDLGISPAVLGAGDLPAAPPKPKAAQYPASQFRVEPPHRGSMQKQASNLKFINSGNLGTR